MNKTKQKILQVALNEFNKNSLNNTTLRTIANACNISQGNLTYHFKHKSEIIKALYFEFVEEMNSATESLIESKTIFDQLLLSSELMLTKMYSYRFFMRDFYTIMNELPDIKEHYLSLQQKRKIQFQSLYGLLIGESLMRPWEYDGEFDEIYQRMIILGDNWINTAILFSNNSENIVKKYTKLMVGALYPYLTEKGKNSYNSSIDKYINS